MVKYKIMFFHYKDLIQIYITFGSCIYRLVNKATNVEYVNRIPPGMSDEQHDYSEIYTPTGNEDERLRQPPGATGISWDRCGDTPNSIHGAASVVGASTGTTTTNESCR